jgi:hypothetical protein
MKKSYELKNRKKNLLALSGGIARSMFRMATVLADG